MINKNNYKLYVPLFFIALIAACYCCYLIILVWFYLGHNFKCRFHYSVDVFVAIVIVFSLWITVNMATVISEVSPDLSSLPVIVRDLASFMKWLNN